MFFGSYHAERYKSLSIGRSYFCPIASLKGFQKLQRSPKLYFDSLLNLSAINNRGSTRSRPALHLSEALACIRCLASSAYGTFSLHHLDISHSNLRPIYKITTPLSPQKACNSTPPVSIRLTFPNEQRIARSVETASLHLCNLRREHRHRSTETQATADRPG